MENIILPSMTSRKLKFPAGAVVTQKDDTLPLGRIYGEATAVIMSEDTKSGDLMYGLKGQFYADNYHIEGTRFSSGKLYLPGGINEMIVEAVMGDGEVDDKGRPVYNRVKFAVEVSSVKANNPLGYSYEFQSLIDAQETDLERELLSQLPERPKVKALEAPK